MHETLKRQRTERQGAPVEKQLYELPACQKINAYAQFLEEKSWDTFRGFSKMLNKSLYRVNRNGSVKMIQCTWGNT